MFAPCVCSLYECRILCAARVETSISLFFFRILRRPHVPHTSIRYGYQVFLASSNSQQVPRSFCCTKRLSPLKLSHGHHVSARAASARAARGRCFDPKRAATAPGCRACSASRDHRVGFLLIIVGQDQTQTAAAARGARRQLPTMAHTSTASSAPDAVPRLPG